MCWQGGKTLIKKRLGKVDVVLLCFHYVQQVCLVPDWLVCASCNESGLLLKTLKINILVLLWHSALERFERLAGGIFVEGECIAEGYKRVQCLPLSGASLKGMGTPDFTGG